MPAKNDTLLPTPDTVQREANAAVPDGWEGSWAALTEDEGYKVDLRGAKGKPDIFYGEYLGVKIITQKDADGKTEEIELLLFKDRNGDRCNMWMNYRLKEAVACGMKGGDKVKIVHYGKESLDGTGGRSINRISVFVMT